MEYHSWDLKEAIVYFKRQGAPQNQSALVELLREVQQESGGVLPIQSLTVIAQEYGIKPSLLSALIKRYPSLYSEEVPHRLEVCGDKRCQRQDCARLHAFIEREFGVKSGQVSREGGFSYRVTGCMKNCGKGPSLKWDGKLYPFADDELVLRLVQGEET